MFTLDKYYINTKEDILDYKEEKSLKGSETAKNLMKAFLNETHAYTRYEYYAKQAKKDGYVQIQNIFQETADNEAQHAKQFYRFLNAEFENDEMPVEMVPVGIALSDTLTNLKMALAGEKAEMSELYPEFSRIAKEEGYPKVAETFRVVASVEENHAARYEKLIENIENDRVFKKPGEDDLRWKCLVCGYIGEGEEAPEECPSCFHPQAHFEIFCANY